MKHAMVAIDGRTYELHLAKVLSAAIFESGHGMVEKLEVAYDERSRQGIGLHALTEPVTNEDGSYTHEASAFGMDVILSTIRVGGAESWEGLVGRYIYVLRDPGSTIPRGIANPLNPEGNCLIYKDLGNKHFPKELDHDR